MQELLGHESLETVLNYVKLAEQDTDGSNGHSPVDAWKLWPNHHIEYSVRRVGCSAVSP